MEWGDADGFGVCEKDCSGIDKSCNWVMCVSVHYTDLALCFWIGLKVSIIKRFKKEGRNEARKERKKGLERLRKGKMELM